MKRVHFQLSIFSLIAVNWYFFFIFLNIYALNNNYSTKSVWYFILNLHFKLCKSSRKNDDFPAFLARKVYFWSYNGVFFHINWKYFIILWMGNIFPSFWHQLRAYRMLSYGVIVILVGYPPNFTHFTKHLHSNADYT